MAYNEKLAQRVRTNLAKISDPIERKMFGGLAFMIRGNMCCGVTGSELMLRVGPEAYEKTLRKKHVREMDFTGKPLKGMVYITESGIAKDADLKRWLNLALEFVNTLPEK